MRASGGSGWKPRVRRQWTPNTGSARSALLWIEGDLAQADAALEQSVALLKALPHVGAYEYDRDCVEQLRVAISASLPRLAAAC